MSPARSTSRNPFDSQSRCVDVVLLVVMSSAITVAGLLILSAVSSHWITPDNAVFGESVQWIESLRSLVVSVAVTGYFAIRWLRSRQHQGFERYFDRVTAIEKQVQMIEAIDPLDLKSLERLRRDVTRIKADALDRYASGTLRGEERMSAFLTHAIDIRNYVQDLILYERERLDERRLMQEFKRPRRRRGYSSRGRGTSFENAARSDFRVVADVGAAD